MYKVLPLFSSNFSLNSVLTLDAPEDVLENGPQSIIRICKDNNLDTLFLVENNFSGFLKALDACKISKINLNFGIKFVVCNDITDKSNESLSTEHKLIIFARNDKGYKILNKLYSIAATDGFYYIPRLDYDNILKLYDENLLNMTNPFYDSFLHRNLLSYSKCLTSNVVKQFFIESNNLPFDGLIREAIENYRRTDANIELLPMQSISYNNRCDFKQYMSYRAIKKRTTLSKPNLDHCSSNEFCFEKWKEVND